MAASRNNASTNNKARKATSAKATPDGKPKSVPASPDSLWQERAVERSVTSARLRALARSSAFLAAAMELLEETGDIDFTVHSIIERSQLSLRAFYQHFASKDELLLSLFEELATQFVEDLASDVEDVEDPFDRLEAYVRGFLRRAHASTSFGGRAWAIYQMRLATDRPEDYAKSIARQLELLVTVVRHGVERGVFRSDLPEMAVTRLIDSTLISIAQMDVFGIKSTVESIGPDEAWSWCRAAVAAVAAHPTATAGANVSAARGSRQPAR